MDMHHVRYFLAVAREANFTRAARLCNVSQPALSRAITQLEAEFGGRLFLREPSNVRLTELGAIVEPHLAATLKAARSAKSVATELRRSTSSRLRVGVLCTLAPCLFTDLFARMARACPDVALSMVVGSADDMRAWLVEGRVDVAIHASPDDGAADERLVRAVSLFRERMVVVVPRAHRLARAAAIDIADLDGEPFVARAHCEFSRALESILETHDAERRVVPGGERDDWAQEMVAAGAGFAYMPMHGVTHAGLARAPLVAPDLWRDARVVTARDRQPPAALGAFLREIAATPWPCEATARRRPRAVAS